MALKSSASWPISPPSATRARASRSPCPNRPTAWLRMETGRRARAVSALENHNPITKAAKTPRIVSWRTCSPRRRSASLFRTIASWFRSRMTSAASFTATKLGFNFERYSFLSQWVSVCSLKSSNCAWYRVQSSRNRAVASASPGSVMLASWTRSSSSNFGRYCAAWRNPRSRSPITRNIAALSMRSSASFIRCAASTLRKLSLRMFWPEWTSSPRVKTSTAPTRTRTSASGPWASRSWVRSFTDLTSSGCWARPGPTQDGRNGNERRATDHVVPKETDPRIEKYQDHHRLREDRCPEDGRSIDFLEKESDQKHPEHRAIEDRAENVHRLNQVVEQRSECGKEHADDAPENREELGGEQVVVIASVRLEGALVEIDHGGGAEGVQRRRGRRHRGAENDRHQQSNQSRWKMLQNEADEDVVRILSLGARIGRGDHGLRPVANRPEPCLGRSHVELGRIGGGNVVRVDRGQPSFQAFLFLAESPAIF